MNSSHEERAAYEVSLEYVLDTIFKQIRRSWYIGALLILLAAGAGFGWTKLSYKPRYLATTTFSITSDESSITSSGTNYYNKLSATEMAASFKFLLESSTLVEFIKEDLGVDEIKSKITAEQLGQTNMVQIQVQDKNPQTAYDVLQSVVAHYPQVSSYIMGATSMKILEESGLPKEPKNKPGYKKRIFFCVAAAVFFYLMQCVIVILNTRTIRNKKDLTDNMNLAYLGCIPYVKMKKRKKQSAPLKLDEKDTPFAYIEAVDHVQSSISKIMKKQEYKSCLVTSTVPNEGKTTVTCNLAMAMTRHGHRVLLIDGDLRNPSVGGILLPERSDKFGLSNYLNGEVKLSQIICRYKKTGLYVVPGGTVYQNSAALLDNINMKLLFQAAMKRFDYILIDTPPCSALHDASVLLTHVDAGILVVREDVAHINQVKRSLEVLTQGDHPVIGAIINGETAAEKRESNYRYASYRYGGYSRYGSYGKYGKYGKYNKYSKYNDGGSYCGGDADNS